MSTGGAQGRLRERLSLRLDIAASIAMLVASVIMVSAALVKRKPDSPSLGSVAVRPEPPIPSQPISLLQARFLSSNAARVVVVEYSDFQCPYCGQFARETLPRIDENYLRPGRVSFAFRELPLTMHPLARKAAEGAECAARQGKLKEMHDSLFADQAHIGPADIIRRAKSLGLNAPAFETCFMGQASRIIDTDVASAEELQITGTPMFLFGIREPDGTMRVTNRLTGARPYQEMQALLDQLLHDFSG